MSSFPLTFIFFKMVIAPPILQDCYCTTNQMRFGGCSGSQRSHLGADGGECWAGPTTNGRVGSMAEAPWPALVTSDRRARYIDLKTTRPGKLR